MAKKEDRPLNSSLPTRILTPNLVAILSFILVVSGHAVWIHFFGVDVPFRDQWSGELPWYKLVITKNVDWEMLIAPHNEHRIAATRIFNTLIFKLLGGWHPIAVVYAQTVFIGLTVAILTHTIWIYAGRLRGVGTTLTILAFSLPYSWQNILNGFQNQFYFMLLFAISALSIVSRGSSWKRLSMGMTLALASQFVMASGLLLSLSLMIMFFLLLMSKRLSTRRFLVAMALMIAVMLWQILLLNHVSGHDPLKAHSVAEFVIAFVKVLSWAELPVGLLLWGLVLYAVLQNYWATRVSLFSWLSGLSRTQIFVICLCAWLLMQLAATAYARAHSGLTASRYQQIYSLIVPVFFLCSNLFNLQLRGLRSWVVVCLIIIVMGIRTVKEWGPVRKESVAMEFAKHHISKAVALDSFSYLKTNDDGHFSLGFPADGIWQAMHEKEFLPYHLWLKKENNP